MQKVEWEQQILVEVGWGGGGVKGNSGTANSKKAMGEWNVLNFHEAPNLNFSVMLSIFKGTSSTLLQQTLSSTLLQQTLSSTLLQQTS